MDFDIKKGDIVFDTPKHVFGEWAYHDVGGHVTLLTNFEWKLGEGKILTPHSELVHLVGDFMISISCIPDFSCYSVRNSSNILIGDEVTKYFKMHHMVSRNLKKL